MGEGVPTKSRQGVRVWPVISAWYAWVHDAYSFACNVKPDEEGAGPDYAMLLTPADNCPSHVQVLCHRYVPDFRSLPDTLALLRS